MRASRQGDHISGAERIVDLSAIDAVVCELVARARDRNRSPDQIIVNIEDLGDQPIQEVKALDLVKMDIPDVQSGRFAAIRALQAAGVSGHAAETAVSFLRKGASPSGEVMRGAIIMDSQTGERLERNRERGVRASRFDWEKQSGVVMRQRLSDMGLSHFRTFEALALATKVAYAPGIVAEICWSDEPDYTAGYVASLKTGYVRFPALKEAGDTKGGRVFFVDAGKMVLTAFVRYLQFEPVLIRSADESKAAATNT